MPPKENIYPQFESKMIKQILYCVIFCLLLLAGVRLTEGATEIDEHLESISPQGQTLASQTDFQDPGKERLEKFIPGLSGKVIESIEILRDDLHRQWTLYPSDKHYTETELSSSTTSGSAQPAFSVHLPEFMNLQASFPTCDIVVFTQVVAQPSQTISEIPVHPFTLSASMACIDKSTKKEIWSYRVREKLWMSDPRDFRGLPSQSRGRFSMQNMPLCQISPNVVSGGGGFAGIFAAMKASMSTIFQMNLLLA